MSVQNGICTCEVFQIEISDGSVHWLGSCQNINLYPARVFTGIRVFRSLYAFRDRNDHSNLIMYQIASSLVKHFKSRFQMGRSTCLGVAKM